MRVRFSFGVALMLALGVGCGEEVAEPAGRDGGASPEPDAAKAPEKPALAEGDDCKGAKPGTVLLDGTNISSLRASNGELFFVDRNAGGKWLFNTQAGALRAMAADGTGARVLYTGVDDERLGDIWADEQYVYVLIQTIGGLDGANLYRVPRSGGVPELLTQEDEGNYDELFVTFVAADAENLYISDASELYRVSKASGAEQRIAEAGGLETVLYQDKIWFTKGSYGVDGIFSVAKDTQDATPTEYTSKQCLGLAVNAGGVFCAGTRVDVDGTETELQDELGSGGSMSVPFDGKVYLATRRKAPIVEADPVSFAHRTIACGATLGTSILAMGSAIFWIESRTVDGGDIDQILRASL